VSRFTAARRTGWGQREYRSGASPAYRTHYSDLDVSGGKRGRRDYLAMLERIRNDGSVKVVAFYDPSRIARDNLLSAEFYALMEQHPDIAVALVEGGPFDRSPSGEFTWTVLGAAATHLRKETGVKIRASKRYAASQGQMVGQVPAGYRWQGEGRNRELVIDEELAPIVRRVFDEYATGRFSARDIARRLNAEGIALPSFKGGWRMDTVSQMLGNPAYAGYTYLSRKLREGELIRGQWPAIVELDTWQAVQLLLQRRRIKHGGRKTESETRPYVFRGLLRCARCGRRMHAHHLHGRNYFDCRGSDSPNPCRGMLREDQLFPWAEGLLQALDAYRPPDLTEAVEERRQQPAPLASPASLAQLDATLGRLGKRFEWGHIDEVTYLAEHVRLTQQREELEQAAQRPPPTSLPLGSLMEGWRTGDLRIRRGLLAAFFDELDVLDGEVISVVPRAEYAAQVVALLEHVGAVTSSRRRRECSRSGQVSGRAVC
jgi:DNA invertase Pin-like site-specific DNA recombinase